MFVPHCINVDMWNGLNLWISSLFVGQENFFSHYLNWFNSLLLLPISCSCRWYCCCFVFLLATSCARCFILIYYCVYTRQEKIVLILLIFLFAFLVFFCDNLICRDICFLVCFGNVLINGKRAYFISQATKYN